MSQDTTILTPHPIPQNSFDLLRLFFAGTVVIAHFMALSQEQVFVDVLPFFDTTVAVMGFFVLSGYLILASYVRQPQWLVYIKKRAKRLLPAYITVVLLCAVLLSAMSVYELNNYFFHAEWWRYVVSNLTFLNFLQPSLPGVFENNPLDSAVNGSLWTIKIEVAFYLSVPVLFYIFKHLKTKFRILIFLVGLYLFSIIYTLFIKSIIPSSPQYESLLFQYPAMFQYFSLGMMVYLFKLEEYCRWPWVILLGSLLFLEKFLNNTTYVWPIGLTILIFALGIGLKGLAQKLLRGNDYSYSIYIWHYPVAQCLITYGVFGLGVGLALSVYIILISIIALLSWHFLEKKFLAKKKTSSD